MTRSGGGALLQTSDHTRRQGTRAIAFCAAAYLYGSLPLVYLLGRHGGVDLKATGSGNVGSSNLWTTGGATPALAGWLFDASKGLLPVVAGRGIMGDVELAQVAGVCGVAGQCWPIFLGFNGGRGISSFVGASFMIDRAAWPAALLPMIGGSLWRVAGLRRRSGSRSIAAEMKESRGKAVPLGCLIGVLAFALGARCHARSAAPAALLALMIIMRRLSAPLPDDATDGPAVQPRALLFRFLYDRNTNS